MHVSYSNVNSAFRDLVRCFTFSNPELSSVNHLIVKTTSRVGDVLQITEPVTITYRYPLQRVLFNEARDANPFFHIMETLWMLGGRRDIAPMAYYAGNYAKQVQDGDSLDANGAYGYRWRKATYDGSKHEGSQLDPGMRVTADQLPIIIDQLKRKPDSRRVVLQMWTVEDDLLKIDSTKDCCCNTNAYFLINGGKLDMTVCNRSNDLVWGALGANVVHFSFLQEYLAANIGVPVGVYHHVTNNLHVYTAPERWKPEAWLGDVTQDYYSRLPRLNGISLIQDPARFERELSEFNECCLARSTVKVNFNESFLACVAVPAQLAFASHKGRNYKEALRYANEITADDWRIACVGWLNRRKAAWLKAKDDGVNYEA